MSAASRSAGSAGGQSRSRGGGALAAAGGVAGLTLVSRALGFACWLVQASTVGAGTVAGAYATANQVPNEGLAEPETPAFVFTVSQLP